MTFSASSNREIRMPTTRPMAKHSETVASSRPPHSRIRFGRLTARSLPLVTADPSGKGIPAWRVYRCSVRELEKARSSAASGECRASRHAPGSGQPTAARRLSRRDRMRDAGPAVARHPYPATVHAGVHHAAAAMLLHEGVEGGKELGHARETTLFVPFRRVPGVPGYRSATGLCPGSPS
jgi:hypothetical protein